MFVLGLLFSMFFVFGPMLVCLDLGLCHVLVCFPFVGLCLLVFGAGVLSQATKNKTYTSKNICRGVSKDHSYREYLA